jgi:hypothetical protein
LGLVLAVCALYGKFLSNPLIFDDLPLFMLDDGTHQFVDRLNFHWLELRSLPNVTFKWTKEMFGVQLMPHRLGNLALHAITACVLYGFLNALFGSVYRSANAASNTAQAYAFMCALFFAIHPLATYAVGYLIQRTVLMSTLFALLCLWAWLHGIVSKRSAWLWLSVPLFYLCTFSKEHAVMLPAAVLLLSVVLMEDWRHGWQRWTGPWLLQVGIALLVMYLKKHVIGVTYELEAPTMLGAQTQDIAYPLSVITQSGLFFKYLGLWVLPLTGWTSIDMREPFVRSLASWHLIKPLLFLLWGAAGVRLIFAKGNIRLLGFAMAYPWVMFLTELASVRIQEPFVIYRSYLWVVGAFAAAPLLLERFNLRKLAWTLAPLALVLFLLSMERLATFSNPILVWQDALALAQKQDHANGIDRIHYNLGRNLLVSDFLDDSQKQLEAAIAIDADFPSAHGALGALWLKKQQWTQAISEYDRAIEITQRLKGQPNSVFYVGRARALEGAGKGELAIKDYLEACRLNHNVCEMLKKSATVIP